MCKRCFAFIGVSLFIGLVACLLTFNDKSVVVEKKVSEVLKITVTSPAELRKAIASIGPVGGEIDLKGDNWHFTTEDVTDLKFFISNHDQSPIHPVNLPIVGCTNLVLRGHGQRLTFDGPSIHMAIINSENISLSDLSFDSTVPVLAEAKIVAFENEGTILKLDENKFPHHFEFAEGTNGRANLWIDHPFFPVITRGAMMFDGKTTEIIEGSGDVPVPQPVTLRDDGTFLVSIDYRRCWGGPGAKVGDIISMRPDNRRFPSTVIHRSKDVTFTDFVIHSSMGMGVIAQVSENFTWRGTRPANEALSGVFPPKGSGRISTLHADATHFSNVKGLVKIENCLFETMMDDALNVHSTCLKIVKIKGSHQIQCRYVHDQAYGFGVFRAGDGLRFIKNATQENGSECKVTSVATLNDREVILTLSEKVPEEIKVGDAVENSDYQSQVIFNNNIVRFNRARGILITTPKPVVVKNNLFDRVSGSAIVFVGDTSDWFESGACTDVLIEKNIFRNCGTVKFASCKAIITCRPKVPNGAVQKVPYHSNIRIVDNTFETFDLPLLFEKSTTNTVWRNNTVITNDLYKGWGLPRFIKE